MYQLSDRPTLLVHRINHRRFEPTGNLTRSDTVIRRDVEGGVFEEEMPWTEQQSHWFRRHHRVILRRWEMRDTECMPEHDVGVLNAFVSVLLDPFGETLGRISRGLGNVAAGGIELIVLIWKVRVSTGRREVLTRAYILLHGRHASQNQLVSRPSFLPWVADLVLRG